MPAPPSLLLAASLLLRQWPACGGARPVLPFASVASPEATPEASAYAKYAAYPPYCSTPDEMGRRAVPPLAHGDRHDGASTLVHVTALIRHGARTPYDGAPSYRCWKGYWENEETGIWDCDLKTYLSPPATTKAVQRGQARVDKNGLLEEEPDFLFEKRFDALTLPPARTGNRRTLPPARTGNRLNGTCQLGQLLMRGYAQELRNGLHLRQAYAYDANATADGHAASDARMRLWDVTAGGARAGEETPTSTAAVGDPAKPIFQEPNLRYRADDEQRTLMSGQILLRGLFEPELLSSGDDEAAVIRLHTADYSHDVLTINENVCPKAEDLWHAAYASDEYKQWIKRSAEVKAVTTFAEEELGMDSDYLDCLMTTICTDRPLPGSLNDYDGSLGATAWESLTSSNAGQAEENAGGSTNMFERLTNFAVKNFTFPYKYNDAAYAKLGMGPLWKEIMANILPIVDSDRHPPSGTPPPKLALFSGHDTTLMPLLATLGARVWSGTEWAPYASMVMIEIHRMTAEDAAFRSGYGFRLIYNGEVLTSKMDGCSSELCDARVLVEQVMPFAKYQDRDCAASVKTENVMEEMKDAAESLVAAPGGVWALASLMIVSMTVGGMLTYFWMKRGMIKTPIYRQESTRVTNEDPGIDLSVSAQYGGVQNETALGETNLI